MFRAYTFVGLCVLRHEYFFVCFYRIYTYVYGSTIMYLSFVRKYFSTSVEDYVYNVVHTTTMYCTCMLNTFRRYFRTKYESTKVIFNISPTFRMHIQSSRKMLIGRH